MGPQSPRGAGGGLCCPRPLQPNGVKEETGRTRRSLNHLELCSNRGALIMTKNKRGQVHRSHFTRVFPLTMWLQPAACFY